MTDYQNYLNMIKKVKYEYVECQDVGTDETTLYNFIVIKDKLNDYIIAAQFNLDGNLYEIYLADGCHTLQEFIEYDEDKE